MFTGFKSDSEKVGREKLMQEDLSLRSSANNPLLSQSETDFYTPSKVKKSPYDYLVVFDLEDSYID